MHERHDYIEGLLLRTVTVKPGFDNVVSMIEKRLNEADRYQQMIWWLMEHPDFKPPFKPPDIFNPDYQELNAKLMDHLSNLIWGEEHK